MGTPDPLCRKLVSTLGSVAKHKTKVDSFLDHISQQEGSLFEGVDGLTVSGYIGAIGGESSPTPSRGEPLISTAVLDKAIGTPQKPAENSRLNDYLDCIAKPYYNEPKLSENSFAKNCGHWAKIGCCKNGHSFAVQIFCRKPYCPICGDIVHQKTIARLLPSAQQCLYGAWLVIPPPPRIQFLLRSRVGRRRFISLVIKALKSLGYRRGIIFTHLFGDDPTKFFFHLNVLVDGGYLEPDELDQLKRNLRRLIYPKSVVRWWGDKLDIFYEYKQNQAMAYHALQYFSRPTFTQLSGNEWLADSIRGQHLIRRWGKWDEAPKWKLDESEKKLQSLVSLEKGDCPKCGERIVWDKPVIPFVLVLADGASQIADGYYELPDQRPPPANLWRPTNLIELPDGDYRKRSNLVKRHSARADDILSLLSEDESSL